jgi:beta-lactamase superfamily II metal-dependent hydrolase
MKLTAFQSDKGDCLLLETASGKNRMLVDGGMRRAYGVHAAPALGALRKAKKKLDIVYVSHIDQDHISGILQMLDDEAAWRVHEHQIKAGNAKHPQPQAPRPPEIGKLYHNSFHDQVGKNSGKIEEMLAATSQFLSGAAHPWLREVAEARAEIVTSIPEAIRVSQRIRSDQLGIPLNPEFKGKLMMVKKAIPSIKLGSIQLKVLGPFQADLTNLKEEWNAWLSKNQDEVKSLRRQAKEDASDLTASDADRVIGPVLSSSAAFGVIEIALADKLGNRKRVTAPNLASLMFLAEEKGQTILLTGDGHYEEILKGLDHHGLFDANGQLDVTVLKVQHHGAEYNIDRAFCDRVTAKHYVFCGNGEHQNPDLRVLQLIFDRRMAGDARKFKFWFNSSSKASSAGGRAHMKKVEALVAKLAKKSKGRLSKQFIKGSALRIL